MFFSSLYSSLNNLMEFDCFIKAFHFLSDIMPEDQLFHEPNEKANEEAAAEVS